MRYIFKNGELLKYPDYVARYGEPQRRGATKGTTIINRSFDAYESPASGKIISNSSARRDDLARTGCIEYDPGIRQDQERNTKADDAALDKLVDETVEKQFHSMSADEKQMLHREMETTTEEYTRI